MNTDRGKLRFEKETEAIIGCAMEVLNTLGHGLIEKPYENAMVVEFGLRGIPCRQQERFKVTYKGVAVGEYIPDLIAYDSVIVEAKVVDCIGAADVGQIMNYMKITNLEVGLILNFKRPRLQWKRVIL